MATPVGNLRRGAVAIRARPPPTRVIVTSSSLHFSTSSSQSPLTTPKPSSTTWERGAKLVKNTVVTNPYVDVVRQEVDPAAHLKTIEDELCAAIGKALGRQGEKVQRAISEMTVQHGQYMQFLHSQAYKDASESAIRYNDARKRAIQYRWELLVHRQAVGFTVDNHSVVHKTFPIGEALSVDMDEIKSIASRVLIDMNNANNSEVENVSLDQPVKKKKVWGDQLSWWENVGRWK
jgi:hypothetical protein